MGVTPGYKRLVRINKDDRPFAFAFMVSLILFVDDNTLFFEQGNALSRAALAAGEAVVHDVEVVLARRYVVGSYGIHERRLTSPFSPTTTRHEVIHG